MNRRYRIASIDGDRASILWGGGAVYRVAAISGVSARVLWEGESYSEAQQEISRHSVEARERGSDETIVLDYFHVEVEHRWMRRLFASRPPAEAAIRQHAGERGKPRILFMPMEPSTWADGAYTWGYATALAYEVALRAAGCEVTTINTMLAPHQRKILRGRRFDQVWLTCHPLHIDDYVFRQWITEIAPVRLMFAGETIQNTDRDVTESPWVSSFRDTYARWAPHVTHAVFLDPADAEASSIRRSCVWQHAVPESLVLPVNTRPQRDSAIFVGTLYPPRDRWVSALGGLVERVESPESDLFQWAFDSSHEWIRRTLSGIPDITDFGGGPIPRYAHGWKVTAAVAAYNWTQRFLKRMAFRKFLRAIRGGVAVVNLPSRIKFHPGRIVEGMAAGRPVLTNRVPGPPAFADDELLCYGSVEELEDQIRRLRSSPAEANKIASRARATVLAKHTIERRTTELLRFAEDAA